MTGGPRRAGATSPHPAPSGTGGRRRTAGLAVTVVLGTCLLLWAADGLARWGAESVLARAVQEQTGVLERPTVRVQGGPVLLQALRGRYDHVEIGVGALSSGPLRVEDYTADLEGVYLSFHDLLDGNTARVHVARASEAALLTHDDLARYLGFTGRRLDVEAAEDGRLQVSGTVDVLGEDRTVSALVDVGAEGAALVLRPVRLEPAEPLEGLSELLVTQRFTVRIPLDPLPLAQVLEAVEVGPAGLAVRTFGAAVRLGS
ncbi:LmeA family phospholipid-binding protein [Geodermatophilus sp. SYSU D00684]